MSSPPPAAPAPPGAAAEPSASPSEPQKATLLDAAKTIRPLEDLSRLPQMPCARYSLLFGIVAGASVGALRFVFSRAGRRGTLMGGGGSAWSEVGMAANWAVGAWGVGSLAEAARMQALVSEIKARRAAKAGPGPDKPIGGILVGDKGREMLRERERTRGGAGPEGEQAGEGDGKAKSGEKSWWSGRI
ncbi:hypothetical protein Rhopal_007409-T1 [Rhodotorula paludigena]|uniref:Cytochrome c oxidase assembly protein COX20, mitochondrial n=1 Tax=Rhodotorula paludigena TaxID=86838 RepID=A0AAV5GXY9_9BASI|nr:hypothetical protein Rhopal_007409-T1 [Rhodotorula paludigena]